MASNPQIFGEDVRGYILDRVVEEDRGHSTRCWIWQLSCNTGGYPQGRPPRSPATTRISRVAYEVFVGPIPEGLELDHLCRVIRCCNPAHLEPVTHAENMRRRLWKRTTVCLHGHPWVPSNIKVFSDGRRTCLTCRTEWERQREKRRSAARRGAAA
jgi:hypothetical protein